MATIDLTTPEPDLIKVRLLAQQLLDLVQPPDDDNGDKAPPPPSDAGQLARQVLGAETLADARALAQAVVDAEDEPSAKRARRGKSPRARHEEAYTKLIVAVCELLAKEVKYDSFVAAGASYGAGVLPALCLPAIRFATAEAHWAKDPMAITPWSVRPYLSIKSVAGSMDVSLLPKRPGAGTQTDSAPVCNAARELLEGKAPTYMMRGSTDFEIASEKTPFAVALLRDPEDFAKLQRMVGDGVIGQAFFKACAAWAWALLKNEHDPEFPAEG